MVRHDILIGREPDRLGGLLKGRILTLGGDQHIALHAPTGSGKTADFVLPNCFTWPGSLVVLDPKGEVFQATAGHRKAMGQAVYAFEPGGRSHRSHRWDPLSAIPHDTVERFAQIQTQANLLFPEIDNIGGGANNNKFWDDVGRKAVAATTCLLSESPEIGPVTMNRIASVFARADGHEWLSEQILRRRQSGKPYSRQVVEGISDFVGGSEKLRDEIRQTCSTRLQTWFYDPRITAATATSDFDLRALRRRPTTIYVIVAPGDIPRLRPILRLFFDQAIALNTLETPKQNSKLRVPLLFMLDEFARLGRTDSLAHAAQYVRAYGIRMAYVMQDAHQLRAIYGEEVMRDIFGNVGAEIVFGCVDIKAAKELEERIGDDTVMFTTRNRPRFWSWLKLDRHGSAEHPHRRPVLLDQEILLMPKEEQLIFGRGMRAARTRRIRWFRDAEFLARVRPPPVIPKLDVNIEYDDGSIRIGMQHAVA